MCIRDSLYTGRELDAETALYNYRARAYDPVQGRFKQLDPIGLAGGANLYQFCGNRPSVVVDPYGLVWADYGPGGAVRDAFVTANGLKYTTVSEAVEGDCGAADKPWTIKWQLAKASLAGGYIIQHVTLSVDMKDCDGNVITPNAAVASLWPFWEAWKVDATKDVTIYGGLGQDHDDEFGQPFGGANTSGTATMTGDATFYEGLTLPANFVVTNKSPTFILPATNTDPGSLPGAAGSITRTMIVTWNCCPCGHVEKSKTTHH